MQYCPKCGVSIKNNSMTCPLCNTPLIEKEEKVQKQSSFLNPPLKFDRMRILKAFIIFSFFMIFLFFGIQFFYPFHFFGLEYVLFGLMITWMMVIILIRKRRNIVKGIVYILALFSILSLYFDYTNQALGWSITFVIPILCISAIIAMFLSLRFVDLKVEDYILYLQLVTIVGIIPLLFLIMNWVKHPLPSIASTIFSVIMFIFVFIRHQKKIKIELQKRMHL